MNQILVSLSGYSEANFFSAALKLKRFLMADSFRMSALYRMLIEGQGQRERPIMSVVCFLSQMSLNEVRTAFEQPDFSIEHLAATLLSYNQVVDLNPSRPIPHPNLQSDILVLHCAAEIQAQYEHPILGRSLQELVNSSYSRHGHIQFEFISKGTTQI